MDFLAIDFEDELFNNLCGGFECMVGRSPDMAEAEEIYKLSLYLYSFSFDVPVYSLSNFFVIANALTYTGVELGMTDLESRTTNWAGLYHYEEDYFFIHSVEDAGGTFLQPNLLGPFVYSVPLFIRTREQGEFWKEFEAVYRLVYT